MVVRARFDPARPSWGKAAMAARSLRWLAVVRTRRPMRTTVKPMDRTLEIQRAQRRCDLHTLDAKVGIIYILKSLGVGPYEGWR